MATTKIKDMKKNAEEAAGQAAAEYGYIKKFINDLIAAEADLRKNPRRVLNDLKTAANLQRTNMSRTERREAQAEVRVREDMATLAKYLPAKLKETLQTLYTKSNVFFNEFTANLSRIQGDFKSKLETLEANAALLEKGGKQASEAAVAVNSGVAALVKQAQTEQEWIAGFEAIMNDYEQLLEYLQEL